MHDKWPSCVARTSSACISHLPFSSQSCNGSFLLLKLSAELRNPCYTRLIAWLGHLGRVQRASRQAKGLEPTCQSATEGQAKRRWRNSPSVREGAAVRKKGVRLPRRALMSNTQSHRDQRAGHVLCAALHKCNAQRTTCAMRSTCAMRLTCAMRSTSAMLGAPHAPCARHVQCARHAKCLLC